MLGDVIIATAVSARLQLSKRRAYLVDVAHAPAGVVVELALAVDGKITIPERIRVFRAGRNESRKGPVYFTARSAELVVAAFERRRGVMLRLDWEHASHVPLEEQVDPKNQSSAAAFFRPETDSDGNLWAVFTDWSIPGREKVENREFRYLSPTIDFEPMPDNQGVEVVEMVSMALTNHPALDDGPAFFSTPPSPKEIQMKKMFEQYMDQKKVGRGKVCQSLGLAEDASDDEVEAAFQKKLLAAADPFQTMPHVEGNPGTAVAPEPTRVTVVPPTGLSTDDFLLKATGAKDVSEAQGKLLAVLSAAERLPGIVAQNAALQRDVQRLGDEARAAKRAASVDALVSAGRLTPAKRDLALSLPDAAFDGFVQALPEQPLVAPSGGAQVREPAVDPAQVQLTAEDNAAFAALGNWGLADPNTFGGTPNIEDFRKMKAEILKSHGFSARRSIQ